MDSGILSLEQMFAEFRFFSPVGEVSPRKHVLTRPDYRLGPDVAILFLTILSFSRVPSSTPPFSSQSEAVDTRKCSKLSAGVWSNDRRSGSVH
jgi:hypothetical protein